MRHTPPVLWTKGVLLTPQHLQAQDRHHEESLAFQVGATSVHPWGFSELQFDANALTSGTLVVTALAGRFADGLLFVCPSGGPPPPPRPVLEAFGPDQTRLTVYLAVAEYRPGARNVARRGDAVLTRWQSEELLARDETTGLAERPLQLAVPALRLLFDGENQEGYTTMPIARLVRDADGIAFDSSFVPPALSLTTNDVLHSLSLRLVERLSARSASLSGSRRQRNQGLADFSVADVGAFWLLYTINTHLPTLRHVSAARTAHPIVLWEALVALAGALTAFSSQADVRALPSYDHLDLGACFARLEQRILALLDGAVVDTAIALPLRTVRAQLQAVAVDQARWIDAPQWFLAVQAPLRQQELISKVLHACKVGSADVVETLIRQALPGLELTHVASPPPAVPVQLDFLYFAISKAGSAWDAIAKSRNLAVYMPAELASARFELVVVLR